MKVIGLAGPAGVGKSVVARELEKRVGIAWVDLDRAAWEVYRPRSPAYWQLVSRFGEGILGEDGAIDRRRLSERVFSFSDEKALADLNAIVHPEVTQYLSERIRAEEARGTKILLVEGALLPVSPHVDRSRFDTILWLEASDETRRARLQAVGREDHLQRRVAAPKAGEAMFIDAEGTIKQVADRVTAVFDRLD